MSIFQLLIQFVFRITLGVSLAMSVTPSRWVSAGFYRVHLWVLMGLNTLAGLTVYTQRESLSENLSQVPAVLALAVGLAVACYVGSVLWLYEQATAGSVVLVAVVVGGVAAAALATSWREVATPLAGVLKSLDFVSSGLVLGLTMTAMFLGHWYLNTPTMQLQPLKRLVLLMGAVIVARGLISGTGLALQAASPAAEDTVFWIFVALRWLAGLVGTFVLAVLTWYTLRIPNTQSATGILYAAVILAFIGELTSQFLSISAAYPL